MNNEQFWYVVKQENGTCEVVSFASQQAKTPEQLSEKSQWGAFKSEQEAIAKKIGLIRAGKCKPQ
ncbi:MAG: hypothetical protein QNJ72_15630 [Pleurocapsa sp. MO_226.B13]|nr:hypothetical protein [Pleurocapsa sp. MO_226.B13]